MAKKINWGTFTPRNTDRYPKLSLDKGQKVRACFIEDSPAMVYVHTFEKVVIGPDGGPVFIEDTFPNGDTREKPKTEYAGKFRCLGDEDVVEASGVDPENCPACRAHVTNPNAVRPPGLRVLGHLLVYETKHNSFDVSKPFSAKLVVWDLTERRFGNLHEIYQEHGSLASKDLLLGPCENKQMQKFDIQVGNGDAVWTKTDASREYVKELFENSRADDITQVAGRVPSEFEMRTLVDEVVRTYNHAFGEAIPTDVSSLLEDDEDSPSLLDEEEEETPPKATKKARKPEPEPEEIEEEEDDSDDEDSDDGLSLEDLLKNIN